MNDYILVGSVSKALRGKELLDKNNVPSSVERAPKNNVAKSCGYSLLIFGDTEKAKRILRSNNIRIIGVIPNQP